MTRRPLSIAPDGRHVGDRVKRTARSRACGNPSRRMRDRRADVPRPSCVSGADATIVFGDRLGLASNARDFFWLGGQPDDRRPRSAKTSPCAKVAEMSRSLSRSAPIGRRMSQRRTDRSLRRARTTRTRCMGRTKPMIRDAWTRTSWAGRRRSMMTAAPGRHRSVWAGCPGAPSTHVPS